MKQAQLYSLIIISYMWSTENRVFSLFNSNSWWNFHFSFLWQCLHKSHRWEVYKMNFVKSKPSPGGKLPSPPLSAPFVMYLGLISRESSLSLLLREGGAATDDKEAAVWAICKRRCLVRTANTVLWSVLFAAVNFVCNVLLCEFLDNSRIKIILCHCFFLYSCIICMRAQL